MDFKIVPPQSHKIINIQIHTLAAKQLVCANLLYMELVHEEMPKRKQNLQGASVQLWL